MKRGRSGRALVVLLAVLWLVAAGTADGVTSSSVSFVVLFALSPLIACSALPAVGTAMFAVAAVALAVASGGWNGNWWSSQYTVRLVDVVLISAAAVVIAAVRVRRETQHAHVVRLAEVAQRAILPTLPRRTPLVAVAARYEAAGVDALIGGDLYDSYHCDAFSRFVVGDVRGKGVAAVEQAARVIRAFRQSAPARTDLAAAAQEMSDYLVPFLDDEEFVTALLVELAGPTAVTLVSCGHPPPLLVGPDGRVALVEPPSGLPLGWGRHYELTTVSWSHRDRLLLYTDGLVEARDAHGEFLPLPSLAGALREPTVDDALDRLLTDVRARLPRRALTDDLAIVLLENVGGEDDNVPSRLVSAQRQ